MKRVRLAKAAEDVINPDGTKTTRDLYYIDQLVPETVQEFLSLGLDKTLGLPAPITSTQVAAYVSALVTALKAAGYTQYVDGTPL